jgi:dihydropteroate synthase
MLINEIEAKNKSLEENQAIMQDEMERLKEKLSETIKEYEIKKKINESEERKEILSLNSQIMHQKGVELSQLTQKQIKLEEALEERATLLNDLTSRMKDTTIRKKQLQNELLKARQENQILVQKNQEMSRELSTLLSQSQDHTYKVINSQQQIIKERSIELSTKKRQHNSLQSQYDVMSGKLQSTQQKLDHEREWGEQATRVHKSLIQEKSQLQLKYIIQIMLIIMGML